MSDAIPDQIVDGLYRIETEATRRRFLNVLSGAGVGLAGIRKATERAFGETPDGVPLVWRYDRYGNPETIRYVPKERHRRIQVYENLHPKTIHERTEAVNGITLEQQSDKSTDLAFKIYVDDNNPPVRRNLPNQIQDIPVIIEEREIDRELNSCDSRTLDFYDPLPANPKISPEDTNNTFGGSGTLGAMNTETGGALGDV